MPAVHLRRVAAPLARDDRRRRHPRRGRRVRTAHGRVQDVRRRDRLWPHQNIHPHIDSSPSRLASRQAGRVGRRAPVLHRLPGAQRRHPADRGPQEAQAFRVRPVHAETDELIVSRTEEEVYERLGLRWVPPAMARTAERSKQRPAAGYHSSFGSMVFNGDLHTHTNLTDGVASGCGALPVVRGRRIDCCWCHFEREFRREELCIFIL